MLFAKQNHISLCSANILAEQIAEQNPILLNKYLLFAEQKAEHEESIAEQKHDLLNKNDLSKMLFSRMRTC